MPRLFVAIRPPAFVRERLLSIMDGISAARWQSEDQFHLTLRFIGEADRRVANDVHTALQGVRHPPFEIALHGLGTFERRGTPAALWAGVTQHQPLRELHKKVDQACQRAGLPPERRAYLPHVTLARLNRASGPVAPVIEGMGGFTTAPFAVDVFHLYESILSSGGSHYVIIETYRLK
ncbi:RNA 2',3'-cyclic phosphodiesterase [Allosphingosinicella flava]|uniref:RNA 2',3'-cyclic phosphodiesterase n=1 Tax=Allosphingosinicella flava TaxID=2771430 RepID=A0A7T2LN00_9SPHN|nr:RNA 2',3'-cyclic phosphodiesterase [Sphingosinicella flava]QPQ56066.1 RNA 2',3'-cyclic phosphodiesterase [Sphingosinicella flava]